MFPSSESRITSALAARRNEFVAALADDVWFAHIDDGGRVKELAEKSQRLGIPTATTHQAEQS
jgi:DNA-binding sugar fermentation-stimulating protein